MEAAVNSHKQFIIGDKNKTQFHALKTCPVAAQEESN